jgi:hypothetical protein
MLRWSRLHVDMLAVMLLAHDTARRVVVYTSCYTMSRSRCWHASWCCVCKPPLAGWVSVCVVSTVPMAPRCCRCPRSPRGRVVVVSYTCSAFVFVSVERAVVAPVLSAV